MTHIDFAVDFFLFLIPIVINYRYKLSFHDFNLYICLRYNMLLYPYIMQLYDDVGCHMSTFDCTLNATVPPAIRDRTTFYKKCIGDPKNELLGEPFVRVTDLKALTKVERIDYLKIDIEGFEWLMLLDMAAAVREDPRAEKNLPLQLFIEFHLDRSPDGGYFGNRLRLFFEEMFSVGYMLMYTRNTVQARNTDGLLVKVLCNPDEI